MSPLIRYPLLALALGAGLFAQRAAVAGENWEVLMCFPAATCMGECRPWNVARPAGGQLPSGCQVTGSFPSFELAKRNVDAMSGRMPAAGGGMDFEYYYKEGERLRRFNDTMSARLMYQSASGKSSNMEEALYAALGLLAVGDAQAAVDALTRARDLSRSKAQFTLVGDAFGRAGRRDLAQTCYDKANTATQ